MTQNEFFNYYVGEVVENSIESRRPGNYVNTPIMDNNQSDITPMDFNFDSLYPNPIINRPLISSRREIVSPELPIGTMYFDTSANSLMVMTESGFIRAERDESDAYPGAYVYKPTMNFKDLDELYIVDEVQKAKKLGYLFLNEFNKQVVDTHPIKIKYFEWCHRSNLPYLIAFKNGVVNSIELYLNPRNVYIGRVFNYCTHDYIIKLFNHYNNGGRIFHNGDTYKLYNILPYRTIEILPKIVNLFRNNNNLDVDY